MCKAHQRRTTFKKLGCRKIARRCGAKRLYKSKCTNHTIVGPLFEVPMSKNGALLWHQAHLQVKMYKTPVFWTSFGGFDIAKVSDRTNR